MGARDQLNISIIDDHKLFRMGLATLLTAIGHSADSQYANGRDFIAQLDSNHIPDLIFLDINMPVMDGYQTTTWLKENHPSILVLAMCSEYHRDVAAKIMSQGANGYIFKTIEPNELKTAIQTVVSTGLYLPAKI